MALGTDYRRNAGKEDKAIARRLDRAKVLAVEIGCDLGTASAVILGRKTMEEAKAEANRKSA